MADVVSDNRFPKIIGVEQVSAPANPSSGERKLYAKSDGWYDLDSTGTETGPLATGAPGGGGGGWTQLAAETLAADAASKTFSGISQAYTDLLLEGWVRTNSAGNIGDDVNIRVGNASVDIGANYDLAGVKSGDTTLTNIERNAQTAWDVGASGFGMAAGASADAGRKGYMRARIFRYSETGLPRYIVVDAMVRANASQARHVHYQGFWSNTSDGINIVTLLPRDGSLLVAGSKFVLSAR